MNPPLLVSENEYCEIGIPNRGLRMLVHFVTDEPTKIPAIRAMLEPQHVVEPRLLGSSDKKIISNGVLMVDADLRRTAPVDGVRHHHEYLDGSGYPDALTAPEISGLVRLLTISDIFAALIKSRPYRPAMPRQDAYNILCAMDGKLERSLVRAFRNVALTA